MKKDKRIYKDIFDYPFIIQKKEKKYQASIISLNLFSNGKTLNEAILNLENEFKKLKLNYKNFEMLDKLEKNESKIKSLIVNEKTILFTVKSLIVAFVFVISLSFLTSFVSQKINQISLIDIMKSESNKLRGFFASEEQNLEQLKKLINIIEPYIKELKKIE